MKVKILILLLLATAAQSQWLLLDEDSPPLLTTDSSAKPNSSQSSPMWSNGKNLYLLNDHMWKYEIDGKRWLWQCPTGIKERKFAASWTMRGIFYVYGGQSMDGIALNDMWKYNPKTREAVQLLSPSAGRVGASFWTHEQSNRLYILGGVDGNSTASSAQLYAFDIISELWSQVQYTGTPDLLPFASATLLNDQVFLYSNDRLWRLDMQTFTWSQVTVVGAVNPPGPVRIHHILWSDGSALYLYGGESGSKLFGDLWCGAIGPDHSCTWTHQSEKILPPARAYPSHTVDAFGSLFINSGSPDNNDLWGFGPISELSLLEKLENGLQSAILWSFISAVIGALLLFIMFLLVLFICVVRCARSKKNNDVPLIMTRVGKNGNEEFAML